MNRTATFSLILISIFIISFRVYTFHQKKQTEKEKLEMLYLNGLKVIYNKDNPFCPEAELAYYDSVMQTSSNSPRQFIHTQLFRAMDYLKLGQEQKAIALMQPIVDQTKDSLNSNKADKLMLDTRRCLALVYLRLGERNNCISNHSFESCIFPIQGGGIYTDPSISEKGIALYKEILQHDSSDLESRWLLNIAYMNIGQYPYKVPPVWLIPGLDNDTASVKLKPFQDLAGNLKLNSFKNQAGGSIVDDFNNDGYLDIVTSSMSLDESMHYFINNGDGTFTDNSVNSGLSKIKGGLNIIHADYNNDGYNDILVLRGAWAGEFGKQPNTLLRNNGDGTFTDVTIESGLLSFGPTQTATWADFNNDGWLDIFIGHETMDPAHPHPSELFINNHDGTFTNVTKESGTGLTGFMKGVVSADYNNDGWPDIFISMLDGSKFLLKNKGVKSKIPQFENATHEAGLDLSETFTFPTWFWDYDNDGWPDIFVCGYDFGKSLAKVLAAEALGMPTGNKSVMYLYRNNHDGTFTDVSKEAGLNRPVFAMGSNFGDFDNDGWLDMYLGTGNPDFKSLIPNKLFKNIDGKKFVDVTGSARVGNLQKGHGVAFADMDNDGDLDIFTETGGAYTGDAYYNSLYSNPGQNDNSWISLFLIGVKSNRSAIGARIEISFIENGKKRTVYRDVNSGGSFGGSPFRKEIGIGKATNIDELKITWPGSQTIQVFKNVKPRRFLEIKEGSGELREMNLRLLKFDAQKKSMNMIDCVPPAKM